MQINDYTQDAQNAVAGLQISRIVNGTLLVLWTQDGRYHMQAAMVDAAPAHTLAVDCTSVERLAAHWQSFCGA